MALSFYKEYTLLRLSKEELDLPTEGSSELHIHNKNKQKWRQRKSFLLAEREENQMTAYL